MWFSSPFVAVVATLALAVVAEPASEKEAVAELVDGIRFKAVQALNQRKEELVARGETPKCHPDNISWRREYGSLSKEERLNYTNAVLCLQKLPARTPAELAPGAKTRYDDFVAIHINQTQIIHLTGCFYPWHRWFLYQYEKALRDECGYTGDHPYWDWPKYAHAPQDSPIFNGDEYSLGGNGEFHPHKGPVRQPPKGTHGEPLQLPAGLGGGLVTQGPFAGMEINLGPVAHVDGTKPNPQKDGLGHNPRKLRRDVGPAINMRYANYTTVLDLLGKSTLDEYRKLCEGVPGTHEIGPHGGIHWVIGGDPGGDIYTSPGDPAFWLHHGMMDRMWAFWQSTDPEKRMYDISDGQYGHITYANKPPSRKASLDDILDMGHAGESIATRDVMDPLSGALCYYYL